MQLLKQEAGRINKRIRELTKDATRYFVNKGINRLKKCFQFNESSGITLANIKIKYNIKLIQFLENKGLLLKVTTRKTTSQ